MLEILWALFVWLLKLPFRGLQFLWWFLWDGLPDGFQKLVDFYHWLVKVYYKLNPGALRAKERKEKAELLISYVELSKKRDDLWDVLVEQADLLQDFSDKINTLDDDAFGRKKSGNSAESIIESFDVKSLQEYGEIKSQAIEYDRTLFKLFVICQKLKLYGIDRGVSEYERS